MILKQGECVLCKTSDECVELARILEDFGYRMFAPRFGTISQVEKESRDTRGFRWCLDEKYPNCIARIGQDMAEELLTDGTLTDCSGTNKHAWSYFQDWLTAIGGGVPDLDDLV